METQTQRQLFLMGFPPMEEALGFLSTKTQPRMELARAAELWRRANDLIHQNLNVDAGCCERVEVLALPAELRESAATLESSEMFRKSFAIVPARIMMVELAPLAIFQKTINLTYVGQLEARLAADMTPAQLFEACLAPRDPPRVACAWPAMDAIQLSSCSNDLRFLEAMPLNDDLIGRLPLGGRAVSAIALVMGFGSNFINAVRVGNRLVLNNGSHRAYALLKLGYTRVPCVVQEVTRSEELPIVLGNVPQPVLQQLLTSPRPPMVRDLLNEALTTIISMPLEKRVVTVQWKAQAMDSPS